MQQPHFLAGAEPADISEGLAPGRYLAQPRSGLGEIGALYATAAAAPASDADYFSANGGRSFVFDAGPDVLPTWCKSEDAAVPVTVALAKVD